MQKVLAEVTDHMEQQYSAHRYLEKLRSENENIAMREKERTVRKWGYRTRELNVHTPGDRSLN